MRLSEYQVNVESPWDTQRDTFDVAYRGVSDPREMMARLFTRTQNRDLNSVVGEDEDEVGHRDFGPLD